VKPGFSEGQRHSLSDRNATLFIIIE